MEALPNLDDLLSSIPGVVDHSKTIILNELDWFPVKCRRFKGLQSNV